ncbi:4-oxalocrotonate tautomerase [Moniliophthora roreri MCA 2997]|uniref:4-oxalocrotonate tautomerase n=2 Tax=Moniliophthora roreri TaxID=221103 RepID=V2XV78_MONRO|nr:4-oxalocrotonate tautomerase [Moniliophthora roreri MCA 2997]KAI3612760.1 4-oxalocrotonate tautomerase [Moniliophthora roreri]
MPFHRYFVPPGLYTLEEKKALAEAITRIYTKIPKFYVVINFINIDDGSYYVGGERNNKFVRICVEHFAFHYQEEAEKRAFMDEYEKAISPWTKDKGIDWEIQISNEDPVFWNMNGLQPPLVGSEAIELWKKEGRPVPYGPYL